MARCVAKHQKQNKHFRSSIAMDYLYLMFYRETDSQTLLPDLTRQDLHLVQVS